MLNTKFSHIENIGLLLALRWNWFTFGMGNETK